MRALLTVHQIAGRNPHGFRSRHIYALQEFDRLREITSLPTTHFRVRVRRWKIVQSESNSLKRAGRFIQLLGAAVVLVFAVAGAWSMVCSHGVIFFV